MISINARPLFSVLIANYNNGDYVDTCIQSVLAQSYENWEIILVDDASTDHSPDIYARYVSDPRIKIYVNDRNRGCGYSKRKCVEHSKGEICGFLDADDKLSTDALTILVSQHLAHPEHSIIYSSHYICDEMLRPEKIADYVGQIPAGKMSVAILVPTISHYATFKRSNYLLTEGVSELFHKAVDKDMYYKLEETGPVLFIDNPVYYYRHHPGSISLNKNVIAARHYELTAKALALLRLGKERTLLPDFPYTKTQLLEGLVGVAYYELKNRHIASSINLLKKALLFFSVSSLGHIFSKGIQRWRTPRP